MCRLHELLFSFHSLCRYQANSFKFCELLPVIPLLLLLLSSSLSLPSLSHKTKWPVSEIFNQLKFFVTPLQWSDVHTVCVCAVSVRFTRLIFSRNYTKILILSLLTVDFCHVELVMLFDIYYFFSFYHHIQPQVVKLYGVRLMMDSLIALVILL